MMSPPQDEHCEPHRRYSAPEARRRELAEDTGLRLGLHIKAAEQAMMAAKTEALRSFGTHGGPVCRPCSPCTTCPEQSVGPAGQGRRGHPQTMATVIANWSEKATRHPGHPSSDHAKVLIASLTTEGETLLLRADKVARRIEQRMAESFTAKERQQLTDMLRRVTSLLRDDL